MQKHAYQILAGAILAVLACLSAQAQLPSTPPDHIVIVIEENHSFSSIIGSSSAPFINSLAQQGALFTNSFAIEHPSEPNYLDLFSGSNQGVTSDACPVGPFSATNLGSLLIGAGKTFKGFSEDLPSTGSAVCTSGAYARKHNPWANFSNVPTADNLPFTSFPTDFTTLPTISIVVPNLNDDMHDGTIGQGDTWLQNNLGAYINFVKTHNSLLIVTWDEDDNSSSNQIPTIFFGMPVKQGQFGETINHFNVLRTLEDLYGLSHAGQSANASPITDVWQTGTDFSLSASPASLSITQGNGGSSTITVNPINGFAGTVSLSASGLPAGVTASFNPSSTTSSSTLTLTASSTATTGTSTVTITGTSGGLTHTTTISLTINATAQPNFSLSASPASVSVTQGNSGTSTITVNPLNGFTGSVSLSASGLPAGVTASFNPSSTTSSSTLTLTASSTATTGTSTVTITGTSGSLTHTTTISLTINATAQPNFSLSASPTSLSVTQGNSGSSTISVNPINGFAGTVSLSASGLPAGVTAAFNPSSTTSSSTLTLTASGTATTGTSTVTITGTSGSLTHTTTISLTINATAQPDFSLSASPTSLTVKQGTNGTSTITVNPANGFTGSVGLSASGLPTGVTASFNPTSTASTSTLTLTSSSTATTGSSTVTITGASGSLSHTVTISLTVSSAGNTQLLGDPGFENGTNTAPWTLTAGVINNSSSEPPHSGSWDAWLDGYGQTHTDTATQTVTIPSTITTATLSFWLHIDTDETTTTTAFDTLQVQVLNTSGTVLATLGTFSNLNHAAGYQQHSFDMSQFKGQTVQIRFIGKEDSSLQTSFVIDDTALNVQ